MPRNRNAEARCWSNLCACTHPCTETARAVLLSFHSMHSDTRYCVCSRCCVHTAKKPPVEKCRSHLRTAMFDRQLVGQSNITALWASQWPRGGGRAPVAAQQPLLLFMPRGIALDVPAGEVPTFKIQ
jgi:hypothetical protein